MIYQSYNMCYMSGTVLRLAPKQKKLTYQPYKVDTVIPILEVRNQGKEKLNNDLDRIPGMQ